MRVIGDKNILGPREGFKVQGNVIVIINVHHETNFALSCQKWFFSFLPL